MRSRRFVIGATVAGLATVVCFPIAMVASGYAMALLGFAHPFWQWMLAVSVVVLLIALAIPLAIGIGVARFTRRAPASIGAALSALVFALVVGPVTFTWWAGAQIEKGARMVTAAALHHRRPIVHSDSLGFCEPPVYSTIEGLPAVRLVARVPRREHYEWRFSAYDARKRQLFARKDTLLDAGVHAIVLQSIVTMAPPGVLPEWPVSVEELVVRANVEAVSQSSLAMVFKGLQEPPGSWWDVRFGDSLAVLQGP
jgi:hypothetical protein